MNRDRRNMGSIEAQQDMNFEDHFIEVHELRQIIQDENDIIYGLKGSGKTALRRGISELNSFNYFATSTIDLDSISFSQVHHGLKQLMSTTNKEIVKLSSTTWRNVLVIYGIETLGKKLPEGNELKERIFKILKNRNYDNEKPNNRLITFIENVILKIRSIGLLEEDETPLGLSSAQLEAVDEVYDEDIVDILTLCHQVIKIENKKVLICLDNFDSIVDHSPESRRAIFSGLVDAIYKCSKDPLLSDIFCFKAFLPRELTDGVQGTHFDADKFVFNTHYLSWTRPEFEKLLVKRLIKFSKTKSTNFRDIWTQFMPDKIMNPVHNVEEDTLSYILRHTLYRPRHLLIHIQNIFDSWDRLYSSKKVDPSFIPKIVSDTNQRLSLLLANELEHILPGIEQFLHSWNGFNTVMDVNIFTNRMNKMFNIHEFEEIRNQFDKLYSTGIFGYSSKTDLEIDKNKHHSFTFAYTNSLYGIKKIYSSLEKDDLIVLSPVFFEFCNCKPSSLGLIKPN
jgi:hypothetical protein